jgi:putative transposase
MKRSVFGSRFGPMFAAEIRRRRLVQMRGHPQWRWHLDEAFVKVNKLFYPWRAVDHEGEVLEAVVTAKRDKAAALKLLKRTMKKFGRPRKIVTDGLCSYSAAMNEVGAADRQEAGGRLSNRAETLHQPFRRRARAMQRFRSMKTLQRFSSVHAGGRATPRADSDKALQSTIINPPCTLRRRSDDRRIDAEGDH